MPRCSLERQHENRKSLVGDSLIVLSKGPHSAPTPNKCQIDQLQSRSRALKQPSTVHKTQLISAATKPCIPHTANHAPRSNHAARPRKKGQLSIEMTAINQQIGYSVPCICAVYGGSHMCGAECALPDSGSDTQPSARVDDVLRKVRRGWAAWDEITPLCYQFVAAELCVWPTGVRHRSLEQTCTVQYLREINIPQPRNSGCSKNNVISHTVAGSRAR